MLVRANITLQPPHPFAGLRGGFYRAISVDPASRFKCPTALQVQNWSSRRDTENHYHTMSFEEAGSAAGRRAGVTRWLPSVRLD